VRATAEHHRSTNLLSAWTDARRSWNSDNARSPCVNIAAYWDKRQQDTISSEIKQHQCSCCASVAVSLSNCADCARPFLKTAAVLFVILAASLANFLSVAVLNSFLYWLLVRIAACFFKRDCQERWVTWVMHQHISISNCTHQGHLLRCLSSSSGCSIKLFRSSGQTSVPLNPDKAFPKIRKRYFGSQLNLGVILSIS